MLPPYQADYAEVHVAVGSEPIVLEAFDVQNNLLDTANTPERPGTQHTLSVRRPGITRLILRGGGKPGIALSGLSDAKRYGLPAGRPILTVVSFVMRDNIRYILLSLQVLGKPCYLRRRLIPHL